VTLLLLCDRVIFGCLHRVRYPTNEKLIKLTNILLLADLEILSNFVDNRLQHVSRVDVGLDAHLDLRKQFLEFKRNLAARAN